MNIQIRIDNDALAIESPSVIVSGSKNYYKLAAVFSGDWTGLSRYAVFPESQCSAAFDSDDALTLPEALIAQSGILTFGIIGIDAEGQLRVATNYARIRVIDGAKETDAAPPSPDESATWEGYIGEIAEKYLDQINGAAANKVGGYTWHIDTDKVYNKDGESAGSMESCMTDDFIGNWFFVRTSTSQAGSAAYPSKYTIDGANGLLSLRDYVIWTGARLVHVSVNEAKASSSKNADGKYGSSTGVDGLMSATDKAYLSDLINAYWGKTKMPVYPNPDPAEGWQTNWLFDDGWYLGGIKKSCGGHPPVMNDNHTSWAVLVLNGMNTSADNINHNHRLQIAFDLVNSKIYMRRGWMSANTWADSWSEVGAIADGSVTEAKLEATLRNQLGQAAQAMHNHTNKTVLDGITAAQVKKWDGEVGTERLADVAVTEAKLSSDVQSRLEDYKRITAVAADFDGIHTELVDVSLAKNQSVIEIAGNDRDSVSTTVTMSETPAVTHIETDVKIYSVDVLKEDFSAASFVCGGEAVDMAARGIYSFKTAYSFLADKWQIMAHAFTPVDESKTSLEISEL